MHNNACKGDQRDIEELFEALTSRFRLFAHHKIRNRVDAEEVVQEALVTVYAEFKTTDFTVSFSAWAIKVLDNRILAYIQRKKREGRKIDYRIGEGQIAEVDSHGSNPDLKRRLLDCLRKLCRRNMRYARILNLHYLGYETGEICEKTSVRPETLYSALSKARSMLERCLETGDLK